MTYVRPPLEGPAADAHEAQLVRALNDAIAAMLAREAEGVQRLLRDAQGPERPGSASRTR